MCVCVHAAVTHRKVSNRDNDLVLGVQEELGAASEDGGGQLLWRGVGY